MDDRQLRESLQKLADRMGESAPVPKRLLRRSRLRIVRNATVGAVGLTVFLGVGVLAANRLVEERPSPIAPSPTPSPAPTVNEVKVEGQVAFLSDRGKGYGQQVFLINSTGRGLRQVSRSSGDSSDIDWSPDGEQIVMDRGLGKGLGGSLILVDVETGEERVIYSSTAPDPHGPAWSPDGSRIAFYSGEGDIYVIRADGTGVTRLTRSAPTCGDQFPAWSPDGAEIAFTSGCRGGGIFIVPANGGVPVRVTDNRRDLQPAWSPDGTQIAFTRGVRDIFVVDVETGKLTQLTETIDSYAPSWFPDGSAIVFGSNRDGTQDIWIMNADGSGESPLTRDRRVDSAPVWKPS